MHSRNICIIPARGGSKRIPRKNIKNFLGKPIITYSIEQALKSGLFEEVMVSTDDSEIANIALKSGANVPFFRTEKNSNDFATTAEVLIEVIKNYSENGFEYDNICCCYPTAPFVNTDRLIEGFELLNKEQVDSVLPISSFDYTIWRSLKENENSYLSFNWDEFEDSRSQDLPQVFHDAGQWYWIKTKSLFTHNKIITPFTRGLLLSSLEVQDIDNIHDWKIAELKYEYLQSIK
ncbi:pseudaminic acid cytidylyltransferase [Aquirufa sp. KTFRIE-69F]|uniref:Pseudaminic acid cytidylyltransferase n=1 Tax=Aquirufa originis TaxID=3096514 RepID=A0ABW6DE80_9BACT